MVFGMNLLCPWYFAQSAPVSTVMTVMVGESKANCCCCIVSQQSDDVLSLTL